MLSTNSLHKIQFLIIKHFLSSTQKRILILFLVIASLVGYSQNQGTFLDKRNDKEYQWVKIGNQVWMAGDLKFVPNHDNLKNGEDFSLKYGIKYNWELAKRICPAGWHLPSSDEWEHLADFICKNHQECNRIENKWVNLANYLKSTEGWSDKYSFGNGINKYGFNGSPEKRNRTYNFNERGVQALYWSSTPRFDSHAWSFKLSCYNNELTSVSSKRGNFKFIRCLKGDSEIQFKPEINTISFTEFKNHDVSLKGKIIQNGKEKITRYGFSWNERNKKVIHETMVNGSIEDGKDFELKIPNITPGRVYSFQAMAANSFGVARGEKKLFAIFPESIYSIFANKLYPYKHVQGNEKSVLRVTAKRPEIKLKITNYKSITNSQKILQTGQTKSGLSFIDIEMCITIPKSLCIDSPFPVNTDALPDSVIQYLNLNYPLHENEFLKDFLKSLMQKEIYTYQTDVVRDIICWIDEYITYGITAPTNPVGILNSRNAFCDGYANVCIALLRNLGIPARKLSCIIPPGHNWGFFREGGAHAFIEVYYPGYGWLPSDPQSSINFVDPFHIVTNIEGVELETNLPEHQNFRYIDGTHNLMCTKPKGSTNKMYNAMINKNKPDNFMPFAFEKFIQFPDGRTEQVSNKRTRTISYLDGKTEKLFANGTIEITFPDGKKETTYIDGELNVIHPNGLKIQTLKDGTVRKTLPDGKKIFYEPNGDTLIIYPYFRKKELIFADGEKHYTYQTGKEEFIYNECEKLIVHTDGKTEMHDYEGNIHTKYVDGIREIKYKNATIIIYHPLGKAYFFDKNDTSIQISEVPFSYFYLNNDRFIIFPDPGGDEIPVCTDCNRVLIYFNGKEERYDNEGNLFVSYRNGAEEVILATGDKVYKNSLGKKWEYKTNGDTIITSIFGKKEFKLNDGNRRTEYIFGKIIYHFNDGSIKKTYPNGKQILIKENNKKVCFPNGKKRLKDVLKENYFQRLFNSNKKNKSDKKIIFKDYSNPYNN